jgi:hypothetical protein
MSNDSVLEIVAYGAWNGGTIVDNSIYEQKRFQFKGGIPVNNKTIEERMGVRTRKAAGTDERIGSRFRVQRLQPMVLLTILIKVRNIRHTPLGETAL